MAVAPHVAPGTIVGSAGEGSEAKGSKTDASMGRRITLPNPAGAENRLAMDGGIDVILETLFRLVGVPHRQSWR